MKYLNTINQCIYCNKNGHDNKLTDEHIIPFCLNGNIVLKTASCTDCQKIINGIESKMGRFYGTIRLVENIQSRNPDKMPKTVSIMTANGKLDINKQHMWGIVTHIKLNKPKLLDPDSLNQNWVGSTISIKNYRHPNFKRIKSTYNIDKIIYRTPSPNFNLIARQYAKIAHAYTVACFGLNNIEFYLPNYILTEDAAGLDKYVGSFQDERESNSNEYDLSHEIISLNNKQLVSVRIRLFPFSGGPDFNIITAELKIA